MAFSMVANSAVVTAGRLVVTKVESKGEHLADERATKKAVRMAVR